MLNFATVVTFSLVGTAFALSPLEKRQAPPAAVAPPAPPAQLPTPPDPLLDVPADAKTLPLTCQDSLYISGMTAQFKLANPQVEEYHVALKLSTSANDLQDIISRNGISPAQVYTRDYDRGFVARLNYGQVCTLDKDARVGTISICIGPNACTPEDRSAPTFPGPSSNAQIQGAPDVSRLPEQCAKVVWYTVTEYDAATVVPDEYIATVKVWVTPNEALQFFSSQPGYIKNPQAEANGYFGGKWTHEQLCAIERNNLVAWVETVEAPPAPGTIPDAADVEGVQEASEEDEEED